MTNLNTASIDDLLALEGIGTQRAAAILKLRDEIGYITYREVEANLQSTASTLHKLQEEGKISLKFQEYS